MKPFTVIVQETEQELINTIEKSNLPPYVLKNILSDIYQQLNNIEQQEIEKYQQEQTQNEQEKATE